MKLAIISDTHDNIPNIEKFLAWAKTNNIERIIHCGDIADTETMDILAKGFFDPIDLVFGNMDSTYRETLLRLSGNWPLVHFHGDIGKINIDGLKIAFTHTPDEAKVLSDSGLYNIIFCGHTHNPWIETLANGCELINPGTLGGVFNKATFAVFDTKTKQLELKVLELI